MIKILFAVGLVASSAVCFAQEDARIDSLRNMLKIQSGNDTARVSTMLNLADAIIFGHPDEAMKYADEGLRLSQSLQWQKGLALAWRQKGVVYYVSSDNLNAMDCFQRALEIGEKLDIKSFEASVLNNIANIYSDLGQFDKAIDYYNRLLEISKELNITKQQVIAFINLGTVYTEKKDFPKAFEYYNEGLALARKNGNQSYAASILTNMGITYDNQGDPQSALKYLRESLDLAREVSNKYTEAAALNSLAGIYLKQGKYDEAKHYSLQSLDISQQIKALEWQAESWQNLSAIYETNQEFDQALNSYKNYVALRDSVMNEQKKSELTKKEMQYKFEKKEALNQAEISRQRLAKNSAMGGAVLLLMAGIMIFIFYKRRRDAEGQKKEAEFKALVSDTEMKALRAQMNPHFIFNSLNSISDYIAKHDNASADYYLTKFSKVMRRILEHSEQKEVSLSDELETLELYMQLESMRLNGKFSFEFHIAEDIDPEATLVPPLILQPFVENSIWHGISKKEGAGKIQISITKQGNMIHCIVEDNGIGRKRSEDIRRGGGPQHTKSLGMKITNARIDILNKIKRTNAGIELSDLEEGLKVQVKLPLELNF